MGRRGLARMGVLCIVFVVSMVAAMTIGAGFFDAKVLLSAALMLAGGGGLVVGSRAARVLMGLLVLGGLVATPRSLVSSLSVASAGGWSAPLVQMAANGVATTALAMWLCARGILVLGGKRFGAGVPTARIVGLSTLVIAATHLWAAAWTGVASLTFGVDTSFSFRISALGVTLAGFPGWPLWHLVMLAASASLAFGPRRMLAAAATAMAVLLGCLVLLVFTTLLFLSARELWAFAPIVSAIASAAALAWWLRLAPGRARARSEELRATSAAQGAAAPAAVAVLAPGRLSESAKGSSSRTGSS